MQNSSRTAAILIIGNEILSGRTQDTHVQFLAKELSDLGILLKKVVIIPDDESEIITCINELRRKHTYVFTTGGIGPTHDDITSQSLAKAFEVDLCRNETAVRMIQRRYKESQDNLTEEVFKMADIPKSAKLITNDISGAPGFYIDNVFVLAGLPDVNRSMFQDVKNNILKPCSKFIENSISVSAGEGLISKPLSGLQDRFPELQIGSYPFAKDNTWSTKIVIRGKSSKEIKEASDMFIEFLTKQAIEFIEEDQ